MLNFGASKPRVKGGPGPQGPPGSVPAPLPGNGIFTRNSLISSLDSDSPQKINLELNGSLQITLLQIYF